MSDPFDKCTSWKDYKIESATGLYPYFHAIEAFHGATEVEIAGRRLLMLGSDDALGLAVDTRVKEAAANALKRFGASTCGPRALNGSLALHEELEARLASFLGREAVLVTSTSYQAALASVWALAGRGDLVLASDRASAGLLDGAALALAAQSRFRDVEELAKLLTAAPQSAGKLVATDGVFGLDGGVANLALISERAHAHGARLLVDDAYGLGVLGDGGRGTPEYFGVEGQTDLLIGSLSTALGSTGGFIAGPADVIHYIRHHARPMLSSVALAPAATGAALKALEILQAEPQRRARLFDVAERFHNGLRALGYETSPSVTPIVPVFVGDSVRCLRAWRALFDAGVFTRPVVSPEAESGQGFLRASFAATHSDAQVDQALEAFERVGRKLGAIPEARVESFAPVQLARPGGVAPLGGGRPWAAATVSALEERGLSLDELSRMSSREVATRLFDAVETLTWRAANLQPNDLKRLPGWFLEKGATFFLKNGKEP